MSQFEIFSLPGLVLKVLEFLNIAYLLKCLFIPTPGAQHYATEVVQSSGCRSCNIRSWFTVFIYCSSKASELLLVLLYVLYLIGTYRLVCCKNCSLSCGNIVQWHFIMSFPHIWFHSYDSNQYSLFTHVIISLRVYFMLIAFTAFWFFHHFPFS